MTASPPIQKARLYLWPKERSAHESEAEDFWRRVFFVFRRTGFFFVCGFSLPNTVRELKILRLLFSKVRHFGRMLQVAFLKSVPLSLDEERRTCQLRARRCALLIF